MIKIPKNTIHRTRSEERTKLLCFETIDNENYSYNLSFTSNSSLDIPIRDIVIEFSY